MERGFFGGLLGRLRRAGGREEGKKSDLSIWYGEAMSTRHEAGGGGQGNPEKNKTRDSLTWGYR